MMLVVLSLLCALVSLASSLPLDQSDLLNARQDRIVSAVASLVSALGLDVVGADDEDNTAYRGRGHSVHPLLQMPASEKVSKSHHSFHKVGHSKPSLGKENAPSIAINPDRFERPADDTKWFDANSDPVENDLEAPVSRIKREDIGDGNKACRGEHCSKGRRRRSTDEDEVFDDLPDLPDLKADKVELGPQHDDHEPALFDQEFTLVPSERVQREALPEDMSKEVGLAAKKAGSSNAASELGASAEKVMEFHSEPKKKKGSAADIVALEKDAEKLLKAIETRYNEEIAKLQLIDKKLHELNLDTASVDLSKKPAASAAAVVAAAKPAAASKPAPASKPVAAAAPALSAKASPPVANAVAAHKAVGAEKTAVVPVSRPQSHADKTFEEELNRLMSDVVVPSGSGPAGVPAASASASAPAPVAIAALASPAALVTPPASVGPMVAPAVAPAGPPAPVPVPVQPTAVQSAQPPPPPIKV